MMRAEIIESIRQSAFLGLIIILLTATGLVFAAIGTLGFNQLHGRLLDFSAKYKAEHIFHLYDPFNSENILRSFRNESDAEERLMRFHERLENNPYFRYLDLNSQSIYIQNYSGPKKFIKGYEDGRADLNKPVDISGNLYSSVKGMQFSELVFTTFEPSLQSGRYFLSSEYNYREDQPIPLILGSEYQEIYSLGDQLNIYFLGLHSRARVVGFFNKDSGGADVFLDTLGGQTKASPIFQRTHRTQRKFDPLLIIPDQIFVKDIHEFLYADPCP